MPEFPRRRSDDNDERGEGALSDAELANLVLDEDFVNAAVVREPSASERLSNLAVAAPPRRVHDHRARRHPAPRRGIMAILRQRASGAIAVVLIGTMLFLLTAGGGLVGRPEADSPDASTASTDTAVRSGSLVSPFADSPAANFASGTAGLVLPAALATADFSTTDVALALDAVRRVLTASNLDFPRMSGEPTLVLDRVGPETRVRIEALLNERGPSGGAGVIDYITRFPSSVQLHAAGVRVNGNVGYEADPDGGLRVTASHVFAYAVTPGEAASRRTELVVVRRDTVFRVAKGADGVLQHPEVVSSHAASTGVCAGDRLYVRPLFTAPGTSAPVTAVPVIWDVSQPLDATTTCFLTPV